MAERVAIVAGASGVTGRALLEHFDGRDDWRVIGLASKLPEGANPGRFVGMIEYDVFADTTKARRFGFHHVVETEAMFDRMFRDLQRRKVIP
jgi:putative ribosome biogenesis GTPase RsgA